MTTTSTLVPPKTAQDPVLGTVRYCPDCREYWPADTEFFHYTGARGGGRKFHSYCRACYEERRRIYLGRPLPDYLLDLEVAP